MRERDGIRCARWGRQHSAAGGQPTSPPEAPIPHRPYEPLRSGSDPQETSVTSVGSKPSTPQDLSAEIRVLLESVQLKLRGYTADISGAAMPDQLQALHRAMEE